MGVRAFLRRAGELAGLAWLTAVLAGTPAAAAEPARVVVFAAASMADAMTALTERFNDRAGAPAVPSFAASSTLARQIESGAPADVFVSANRRWMDYLVERGWIDGASRCDLMRNSLVLVAPSDGDFDVRIGPGFALAAALGERRLAIADPDHVPAGVYGRQALEALGAWRTVQDRLVRTADVRAALALAARGEVAAAIVYATDAAISDRVRIVGAFPAASHDAIIYPAARLAAADGAAAAAFFEFLVSAESRALLAGFGFETAGASTCPG